MASDRPPAAAGTGHRRWPRGRARAMALRAAGQAVACGHAPPCVHCETYLFTMCICISV